jgi:hypothetical protein
MTKLHRWPAHSKDSKATLNQRTSSIAWPIVIAPPPEIWTVWNWGLVALVIHDWIRSFGTKVFRDAEETLIAKRGEKGANAV